MNITISFSQEQVDSMAGYIASPQNQTWQIYNNERSSVPKYANIESLIAFGIKSFMRGILSQCPPESAITTEGISSQAISQMSEVTVEVSE